MNPAQTIAQLKSTNSGTESLWHFLAQIPSSLEAEIFYGVLLFGAVGMVVSWLVKWSQSAVGGFGEYFFGSSWRRTVATICAYVGAMATGIGAGVFFTDVGGAQVFTGWNVVLWTSITTSFSCDMGINKGSRIVFSDEQRKVVRERYRVGPDELFIGMIGSLKEQKNYKRALAVLAELKHIRKAKLLIAGGYPGEKGKQLVLELCKEGGFWSFNHLRRF